MYVCDHFVFLDSDSNILLGILIEKLQAEPHNYRNRTHA